jgi:hypothetical protein
MTDIYLTVSLSTHNGDDTPQNYENKYELYLSTVKPRTTGCSNYCLQCMAQSTTYIHHTARSFRQARAGNVKQSFYTSSVPWYIVRVIKSRRMRWAEHVARMGEERGCIGSCWGKWREGDQWGDLGVDGWIIFGWISRRWDVGIWTGLGWPRIETGGGSLWVRWWTFGFCEMAGNFLTSCKPVSCSRRTLHRGVSE